jgi:hypothetical protein
MSRRHVDSPFVGEMLVTGCLGTKAKNPIKFWAFLWLSKCWLLENEFIHILSGLVTPIAKYSKHSTDSTVTGYCADGQGLIVYGFRMAAASAEICLGK